MEVGYMNDKIIDYKSYDDITARLEEQYDHCCPESLYSVVKETIGVVSRVNMKFVSGLTM